MRWVVLHKADFRAFPGPEMGWMIGHASCMMDGITLTTIVLVRIPSPAYVFSAGTHGFEDLAGMAGRVDAGRSG